MTTTTITWKALAQIAEKSPGYDPIITENSKLFYLSNIRFDRRNNRRNRAVVLCTYIVNDKSHNGVFNSDEIVNLLD